MAAVTAVACGGPPAARPVPPAPLPEAAPVLTATERLREGPGGLEQITLRVDYSYGSPLLNEVRAPGELDPTALADVLPVRVAFWRLTGPPAWPVESAPLAGLARQVLRSHAEPGSLPTLELLDGVRWALAPAAADLEAWVAGWLPARRAEAPSRFVGALPRGVSAGFSLGVEAPGLRQETLIPLGGRLVVRRRAGREVELDLEVAWPTHRSVATVSGLPELEAALLDPLELGPDQALLIALPAPAGTSDWGVGVVLSLPAAPAPGSAAADDLLQGLRACVAALASSQALVAPAPWPLRALDLPPGAPLGQRGRRRAALADLAARSQAALTVDLVRSATEPQLEALAAAIQESGLSLEPGPALGAACERASLGVLLREEPAPPAERFVLRRFAGGAASEAGWLQATAEGLLDPAALVAALAARNLDLLRDGAPEVRCAAHAWLAARGLAVPDYDPLGTRAARGRALGAAGGRR